MGFVARVVGERERRGEGVPALFVTMLRGHYLPETPENERRLARVIQAELEAIAAEQLPLADETEE